MLLVVCLPFASLQLEIIYHVYVLLGCCLCIAYMLITFCFSVAHFHLESLSSDY